jgi:hypothetical protein
MNDFSLLFRTDALVIAIILFAGCILMVIAGRATRNRFIPSSEAESGGGVNSLLGALFGLWGFVLAFNFGNAAARFDRVREIMVDESNVFRTTILRTGFLPDSLRTAFRADLKTYLEARIVYYSNVADAQKFTKAKADATAASDRLLQKIMQLSRDPITKATADNLFSSLTNLLDVAIKRDSLLRSGVPEPVQYMLFFLALAISFIGGFTTPVMGRKEWIVSTGFALLAVTLIYITLDMSRPLRGLIRVDAGEERMMELRKLF